MVSVSYSWAVTAAAVTSPAAARVERAGFADEDPHLVPVQRGDRRRCVRGAEAGDEEKRPDEAGKETAAGSVTHQRENTGRPRVASPGERCGAAGPPA